MATVSVIIPAFNAAQFIRAAAESVLAQSFTDLELIVVDDGSSDATAEIVRSIPGVQLVSTPNGGVSAARNLGVRQSRGDLVAFLDADDLWHRDKLRAQVALMARYPGADLSYTRVTEDLTEYRAHLEQAPLPFTGDAPAHTLVESLAPSLLLPYLNTSSVLVRRSAFDRVDGFDTALRIAEDVDFYLKILVDRAQIPVVEYPAVFKRPVAGSLSDDSPAGYETLLRVYDRLVETRPELKQHYAPVIERCYADLHLRHAMSLMRRDQRRGAIASLRRSINYHPSARVGALLLVAYLPRFAARAVFALNQRVRRGPAR